MNLFNIIGKNFRILSDNILVVMIILFVHYLQFYVLKTSFESMIGMDSQGILGYVKIEILDMQKNTTLPLIFYASSIMAQLLMTGSVIAATFAISERDGKTLFRLLTAPMSRNTIVTGNLISYWLAIVVVGILYMCITDLFFNIGWLDRFPDILIITVVAAYMCAAMGLFSSCVFCNSKVAGISLAFVALMSSFLSGGISGDAQFGATNKYFPTKWIYESYISVLDENNLSNSYRDLTTLMILGTIFLILTFIIFWRNSFDD